MCRTWQKSSALLNTRLSHILFARCTNRQYLNQICEDCYETLVSHTIFAYMLSSHYHVTDFTIASVDIKSTVCDLNVNLRILLIHCMNVFFHLAFGLVFVWNLL
jgi:hypothetical protein